MTKFTRTDLREIHRCLRYMTKGGTTPYSCHTIALAKKVRDILEHPQEDDPEEDNRLDLKTMIHNRLQHMENFKQGAFPGQLDSIELYQMIGRIKELKFVLAMMEKLDNE